MDVVLFFQESSFLRGRTLSKAVVVNGDGSFVLFRLFCFVLFCLKTPSSPRISGRTEDGFAMMVIRTEMYIH